MGADLASPRLAVRLDDFTRHFGSDDMLLVGLRAPETVFRPDVVRWMDRIVAYLEADSGIDTVVALSNLEDLVLRKGFGVLVPGRPRRLLPERREEITSEVGRDLQEDPFLVHGLVSADGRTAIVWALLTPELRDAPDHVARLQALVSGLPLPPAPDLDLVVTGPPLVRRALEHRLLRDGAWLAVLTILVVMAVGRVVGTPLSALAAFALGWILTTGVLCGLAWLEGAALHTFTHNLLPLLVTVSGATFVHLSASSEQRVLRACGLATLTTMAGFACLGVSDVPALARFAWEGVVGIGVGFLSTALMHRLLVPAGRPVLRGGRLPRRPALWVAAALLGFPWFVGGLDGLEGTADVLALLPADQPEVQDARTLAAAIGAADSFEVIVPLPRNGARRLLTDADFHRRLAAFQADVVASADGNIEFVLSPVTLMAYLNTRMGRALEEPAEFEVTGRAARFAVTFLVRPYLALEGRTPKAGSLVGALHERMRHLLSPDGLRLRFNCRLREGAPTRLLELRDRLVADVFPRHRSRLPSEEPYVTGNALLRAEVGATVRRSQGQTLLVGAVVLSLILLVVVRDPVLWMAAMVTNALTVAGVLSCLVWTGAQLDLYTSILTASVLAILVDDSVHLLLAWRDASGPPEQRMREALRRVRRPIVVSSLALGAGFGAFALSPLGPYRQFAAVAVAAIGLALFWDLAVLPRLVLAVSRGGRRTRATRGGEASDARRAGSRTEPEDSGDSPRTDSDVLPGG